MVAIGQKAACRDRSDHSPLHHDPSLRIVQFFARQCHGSTWTSFRCLWWDPGTVRRRIGFQHIGCNWFYLLFGVSVMSGILIINAYYRIAASGMSPIDAMFHALASQMRPILMMTLSACIGLLPATLSTGIGSQVQRPLATIIVGGMLGACRDVIHAAPRASTDCLGK
jgi:AcrB/AcrD/AcrF family